MVLPFTSGVVRYKRCLATRINRTRFENQLRMSVFSHPEKQAFQPSCDSPVINAAKVKLKKKTITTTCSTAIFNPRA